MFDNIILKKCPQRHDIRHSKDVISRDVTQTLIDFLRKLINAFLLVLYDAKSLFLLPKSYHENYHIFLFKNSILSKIHKKIASFPCHFYHLFDIM